MWIFFLGTDYDGYSCMSKWDRFMEEDIKNLNTHDLRPLLASGEYDKVARTLLERLSTSESLP
jgi:hypothetical protein